MTPPVLSPFMTIRGPWYFSSVGRIPFPSRQLDGDGVDPGGVDLQDDVAIDGDDVRPICLGLDGTSLAGSGGLRPGAALARGCLRRRFVLGWSLQKGLHESLDRHVLARSVAEANN